MKARTTQTIMKTMMQKNKKNVNENHNKAGLCLFLFHSFTPSPAPTILCPDRLQDVYLRSYRTGNTDCCPVHGFELFQISIKLHVTSSKYEKITDSC